MMSKQRMVRVAAAVIAYSAANGFGQGVQIADQLFNALPARSSWPSSAALSLAM